MKEKNGKLGASIKLWCKISFFLLILLGGCFLFIIYPSSVDSFMMSYCHNKIVLVTSFIEDFKAREGRPPKHLKELEPQILEYLENNLAFKYKYLPMKWTRKNIPLFSMPVRGKAYSWKCIELNYLTDKNDYYLYCRLRPTKTTHLDLNDLKSIASSPKNSYEKAKGFVVVYNGKVVYGMMKQNSNPYLLNDLEKNMRKPVGLPPLWFCN